MTSMDFRLTLLRRGSRPALADSPVEGIRRFEARVVVPIAALAGKSQVRRLVGASAGSRHDVLYDEGVGTRPRTKPFVPRPF